MMPARILYVTISNWGVGDELAMLGTQKVMECLYPGHLKFYADKSPELVGRPKKGVYSDIWTPRWTDLDFDLVVHAGGNAWAGEGHEELEQAIVDRGWPVVFLGVGGSRDRIKRSRVRGVMANTRAFIGRDEQSVEAARALGCANAHRVCCPSFFLTTGAEPTGRIGLNYQAKSVIAPHSCGAEDVYVGQINLFARILAKRDAAVLCHFIGDYEDALRQFPGHADKCFYSRVLTDYIVRYAACERILAMRFHGSYLGAALSRPTACLKQVSKCKALRHIGVPVVHPDQARGDANGQFSDPEATRNLQERYWIECGNILSDALEA